MKIPQKVIKEAKRSGETISYLGELRGEQVYSVYTLDKNGDPLPEGLPTLVFFDGEKARTVTSEDNFFVIDALKIPPVEIPQQVKEAAERLGTVITYVHRLKGYDVYSVGMPPDENGEIQPTGLPTLVLYKSGNARIVGGIESFNWL